MTDIEKYEILKSQFNYLLSELEHDSKNGIDHINTDYLINVVNFALRCVDD